MVNEAEFIEWLQTRVPQRASIGLGIGDDAAVWTPSPGRALVVTTDLLADGVHFRRGETPPELIGRKSLAVNLSDLAAMAATPVAAVVSVLWPADITQAEARGVYEGLLTLADQFATAIVGGDTNRGGHQLVVSVTAWGEVTEGGPLLRSGAQIGDWIVVTGPLGGSLLGHHLTFTPRVQLALDLHSRYQLHAGMDISDGLLLDLSRLTTASGVSAELDLQQIPIAPAARTASAQTGRSPLDHALADGEDFELLLTVPPAAWQRLQRDPELAGALYPIGRIQAGTGLWSLNDAGVRERLEPRGYLH